jgi:hypothetical protein
MMEWLAADGGARGLTGDQDERWGRHRAIIRETRLNLFKCPNRKSTKRVLDFPIANVILYRSTRNKKVTIIKTDIPTNPAKTGFIKADG